MTRIPENILARILPKEHIEAGIRLEEVNDDFVRIVAPGKEPVTLNIHSPMAVIRHEAHQLFCEGRSGVEFGR